jgi:ABC-type transport system involved in multi-copper enzyme maturation permease subunit
MISRQKANDSHAGPSVSASPTWWVIFSRELTDLWVGGKALYMILIYTVLLGIYSYLLASNVDINLLPMSEMVLEMVKVCIAAGLFICLIIGADSFSRERERRTLEAVLLTPASRRQIVAGKFLAAVSAWPVVVAITFPYWAMLFKGDAAFGQAVLWSVLLGSLLAPALAGLGMLVSISCNTNKISMLVSLCLYLLLLMPTELMQTTVQQSSGSLWEEFSLWVNPLAATSRFFWKVIVNNESPAGLWLWHVMPVLFTLLTLILLFAVASPRVRLYPEALRKFRSYLDRWSGVVPASEPRPVLRQHLSEPEKRSQTVLPQPTTELRQMSDRQRVDDSRTRMSRSAPPSWWLVFKNELHNLWIGGRALPLILTYTIVVGIGSFLAVWNSQLDLIPPKEMVFSILRTSIYVGVFMGVILGADSLSGARERAVLEPLLLTPASRRQIMVGKFLASISPWPVALAVSFPCLVVLSQGDAILGPSLLWIFLVGSLLVLGFAGLGMLVSFWSASNTSSLFVSLCLYLLFLLPAFLPGRAQKGYVGKFFQRANPLAAADEFLEKILVNNQTFQKFESWLQGPIAFPILILGLLLLYAGPRLRLQAGRAKMSRTDSGKVAQASI